MWSEIGLEDRGLDLLLFSSRLSPSTVSGLLPAVEATLRARIGATSEPAPPLANAEPDERVTRGMGLSAQDMVARAGSGERFRREKKERKKSGHRFERRKKKSTRSLASWHFSLLNFLP